MGAVQNLEATVKDEPGLGVALLDCVYKRHQPVLLGLALLGGLGKQVVGIEGVQKKCPVAACPQGCDGGFCKKGRPVRLRLVDDQTAPILVFATQPGLGNAVGVGPGGVHLAHRYVGRQRGLIPRHSHRVSYMVGLDHDGVKGL